MDGLTGFWTGKGSPSVVDWCEPNYVVTPYVAEFWNSLSSLLMVALGLWGLRWWWTHRDVVTRRFAWCFVGLLVVGAGSAAFHGTLLRGPQALDELPMVYVGLVGAWCVRHRDHPKGDGYGLAVVMGLFAAGFTAAYAMSESYFTIFLSVYVAVVAYVALKSMWHSWVQASPRLIQLLLVVAAGGFLGGLTVFWLPEHVFLACDHPLQALQLHSWWHVGAGTGTYVWVLWAVADRWRVAGRGARVQGITLEQLPE